MTRWNSYPVNYRKKKTGTPCADQVPLGGEKKSKYHSVKKEIDGIVFDSTKEARRYQELKTLQEMGQITDLELQKKFVLIPTQREPDIIGPRGGVKKGRVIEKEIAYYADFYYKEKDGSEVVEDTKSAITRSLAIYVAKRKMMLYFYGIRIKEV